MNRSILIVICDFLLVSLLAFSTVDINKVADTGAKRELKLDLATNNAVDVRKDLGNVMRMALEDERKAREAVLADLAKTRDTAAKQQALLAERDKQAQDSARQLQAREQEARRLQQEQTRLQQQYALAQTNLQTLNQQLQEQTVETQASKEKITVLETQSRQQAVQAAALQNQLQELGQSNRITLAARDDLATKLQVAEAERRAAEANMARMQEEIRLEREEKARLAEGVQALATRSSQLEAEIRDNRPLAPNTIFNEFVSNRVTARIEAGRSAFLGIDSNRRRQTGTILVTDGAKTYALCHVQDTPFVFLDPAIDWESLSGSLIHGSVSFPIASASFFQTDPRILLIPVGQTQAQELGCKVYRLPKDPYKFQDAVVIGAGEGYYGECKFQIDLTSPQYLKMDHNTLKGLFGKFNPSRGDLVFSKKGELLGVMANSTYCMMIKDFRTTATLDFGKDVRAQHTGTTLKQLYWVVMQLPNRLQ